MDVTLYQSCLQLSKRCAYEVISYCPSFFFEMTLLICQFNPRFANQSLCFSRYLSWTNFIAQSITIRTDVSLRSFRATCLAFSWFSERRIWAFHEKIASLACKKSCIRSSRCCSIPRKPAQVFKVFFTPERILSRFWQRSQICNMMFMCTPLQKQVAVWIAECKFPAVIGASTFRFFIVQSIISFQIGFTFPEASSSCRCPLWRHRNFLNFVHNLFN